MKGYNIKSEMKGSTDRTGCDIVSDRSGNSLIFGGEKLSPFKNWLSQNFLFFSFIIVEKQLSPIFETTFFVLHQYNNVVQYQTHASRSGLFVVIFYLEIRKFGSPSFFSTFIVYFLRFMLYCK